MNLPFTLPFEIDTFGRVALLLIVSIAGAEIRERWLRL